MSVAGKMSFSALSALKASCRSVSRIPWSCLSSDSPFNRDRFRALHDRSYDRAADEIAAVKRFFAAAAQGYFQKFIFIATGKLPVNEPLDQAFDGRADSIDFLRQHAVVWQIVGKIDPVNFARAFLVWTVDFDFSVIQPDAKLRMDRIPRFESENNHDVIERIDSIHLRAEHRHQRGKNV